MKLPWFKFYAQDWLTDPRVLALTNEQRGIYHWLLCRQWHDGDLPGDVMHIYPLLPPGSDSAAVAYILTTFFPADPDTTRRSNPRLAEQQEERQSAYASRVTSAGEARKARARKSLSRNAVSGDQTGDQGENQKVEVETDNQPRQDVMLDPFVLEVATVANQALRDNPAVRNAEVDIRPLKAANAATAVADWLRAGVSRDTILKAVAGVCARYTPTPENRRIGSWRYFDQAVMRAHAESKPDPLTDVIVQMQAEHESKYGTGEAA